MAITDLTGTTWYFNETLNGSGHYSINFTCNAVDYTEMEFISEAGGILLIYRGSTAIGAYDTTMGASGWQDPAYRTITITGGTGATNATLIAFFEANAIQVEDSGGVAT